ncbi:hypothetical protein AU512_09720 [Lonsdalea iberica]|uniref:Flagellar protein FlhE n=1 Tax=Lonsdalea iberica TaxID=1082703 RepID=A0ABX3XFB3_9GAMM|nr:hypothetical protein [Lonsdalea iberica]OSN10189.1 hypothetical protein AU512_09720 [Lonsdalea iberica]
MKSKLLTCCLLAAAFPLLASAGEITKSSTPYPQYVPSSGAPSTSFSSFHVYSADFPKGSLIKTVKLISVSYQTTRYSAAYTDNVQLCYFNPYQASPARCVSAKANSTGTTTEFDNQIFSMGAQIQIRHELTGFPRSTLQPAGKEFVTFNYGDF